MPPVITPARAVTRSPVRGPTADRFAASGGGAAPAYAYLGTDGDAATSTVGYTLSAFNGGGNGLGTEHANRVIVVGVLSGLTAPTSVTVAGNSMGSPVVSQAAGSPRVYIYALALPTGASGNIVIDHGGASCSGVKIAVWAIYPASSTATGFSSGTASLATNAVANDVAVNAGGVMIYFACQVSATGSMTAAWTGVDPLTTRGTPNEVFDSLTFLFGDAAITANSTLDDLTINPNAVSGTKSVVVASWGA